MTEAKLHPLETAIQTSRRLRAATKRLYLSIARGFLAFAAQRRASAMTKWNGALVEAWRDAMEEQGLDVQTINVRLYAMRFASARLRELGAGPDFAAGAETLPPVARRTRKPLSREDAQRLLAPLRPSRRSTPPDLRDRAALLVCLHSGIRVGGLVGLDATSIVPSGMSLILKGGKPHTTPPLHPEALAAVGAWRAWLGTAGVTDGPLFRGLRQNLNGSWVVLGGMSASAVRKMVIRRAKAAGLERRLHPHIFRHTFVSWMRASGVPDWQIALYTGHSVMPGVSGAAPTVPTLGVYTGDVSGQHIPMPAIEDP